jgi:hypothetical protein
VATVRGRATVRHRGRYVVVFAGRLHGQAHGRIRITMTGTSAGRRDVALSAGAVTYTVGSSHYRGPVTSIRGHDVDATLTGPAGRLRMTAHLIARRSQAFIARVELS